MLAIAKKEFLASMKGFKSIAIIVFILVISISSANVLKNKLGVSAQLIEGQSSYTAAISFIFLTLGFLFVFMISHDIVNREVDSQTTRLLVTKVSRVDIILGKFIGVLIFWLMIITVSLVCITAISKSWNMLDYVSLITFIIFPVSLNIFISTVVNKPSSSLFIVILLGIIIPLLGIYSAFDDSFVMNILKYILPYDSIINQSIYMICPLLISVALVFASIKIFDRKDL